TAYKLAEYGGKPKMKLSEAKATLPGKKQVFRVKAAGRPVGGGVGPARESGGPGGPFLIKEMEGGRRTLAAESLEVCRERCRAERNAFPPELLSLEKVDPAYPIELSGSLKTLALSFHH